MTCNRRFAGWLILWSAGVATLSPVGRDADADDAKTPRSTQEWLAAFDAEWNQDDWAGGRGRRAGYMRPLEDSAWKTRMLALQAVVAQGEQAAGPLLDALENGNDETRVFAVQALGYLPGHASREALLAAARRDAHPAVRLYAVDALGMQGDASQQVDWESPLADEKDRDVIKHIGYARERGDRGVDPAVVRRLVNWDASMIDSAAVGKPAPDFELTAATGETVRLSDFRGRQAVVLVFIYGDT